MSSSGGAPELDLSALPEEARRLILAQLMQSHRQQKPEGDEAHHAFWDTQPVPKLKDDIAVEGPISAAKTVAEVRQEPLGLPDAFEWVILDVHSDEHMDQLFNLLLENYVEDDDAMFRFAYRPAFLRWALTAPGWIRDWHAGIRVKASQKLVAFISAIPVHLGLRTEKIAAVEINFLCVHKKLRHKRLAPVLIGEITRRVHLKDIWQAVYTAGILLPKPVARCQYWHRSLNPRKLVSVGFSSIPSAIRQFKDPMAATERLYALPEKAASEGLKPMTKKDVASVHKLLTTYLETKKDDETPRFGVRAYFSIEEVEHWLLPRSKVISSYVITDASSGEVTDLISFYSLPSSVIDKSTGFDTIEAAYCFYNVATTVPLEQLLRDALVLAKKEGFDVFNALDMLENGQYLEKLRFGIGDGALHYYLYNWALKPVNSDEMGLVML
eukprot:ANDGO_01075.mRNA.1 Glycylpeptide N-tetradecanoyltransferase 1